MHIKLAKKKCFGCTLSGFCVIKATGREYTCPCLVCPVFVMCKVACEPFTKQTKYAHSVFNFQTELKSHEINERKNT